MGITPFGLRLAQLCCDAGAPYYAVDERAGLGRGHTAMLISGQKKQPVLATACQIARVFGLGTGAAWWLFAGEGEAPSPEIVRAGFASRGRVHGSRIRHLPVSRKGNRRAGRSARLGRKAAA